MLQDGELVIWQLIEIPRMIDIAAFRFPQERSIAFRGKSTAALLSSVQVGPVLNDSFVIRVGQQSPEFRLHNVQADIKRTEMISLKLIGILLKLIQSVQRVGVLEPKRVTRTQAVIRLQN